MAPKLRCWLNWRLAELSGLYSQFHIASARGRARPGVRHEADTADWVVGFRVGGTYGTRLPSLSQTPDS